MRLKSGSGPRAEKEAQVGGGREARGSSTAHAPHRCTAAHLFSRHVAVQSRGGRGLGESDRTPRALAGYTTSAPPRPRCPAGPASGSQAARSSRGDALGRCRASSSRRCTALYIEKGHTRPPCTSKRAPEHGGHHDRRADAPRRGDDGRARWRTCSRGLSNTSSWLSGGFPY